MDMIWHMTDGFEVWLSEQPPDTFNSLKEALQCWVEDSSDAGAICATGGNYAAFLQVAVFEYAKAAHDIDAFHEVLPGDALVGSRPKAFILSKDAELLDERWYQHAIMLYQRNLAWASRRQAEGDASTSTSTQAEGSVVTNETNRA